MREYVGPAGPIHEVAFVPGDRPRLAALTDGAVYLWDPDRPEPVAVLPGKPVTGAVGVDNPLVAASPDGRWLAAGAPDRLRVWDLSGPTARPAALSVPGRPLTAR